MSPSALPPADVAATFKNCSNCDVHWPNLDAFMRDPAIELVGYMPTFDNLANGLILFNHGCGTTLACRVEQFKNLFKGPVYQINKQGGDDCPGYCQNKTDFSPCPIECSCAFVRDALQIIKQWPKSKIPRSAGR
jgi:hypothetical protein